MDELPTLVWAFIFHPYVLHPYVCWIPVPVPHGDVHIKIEFTPKIFVLRCLKNCLLPELDIITV